MSIQQRLRLLFQKPDQAPNVQVEVGDLLIARVSAGSEPVHHTIVQLHSGYYGVLCLENFRFTPGLYMSCSEACQSLWQEYPLMEVMPQGSGAFIQNDATAEARVCT